MDNTPKIAVQDVLYLIPKTYGTCSAVIGRTRLSRDDETATRLYHKTIQNLLEGIWPNYSQVLCVDHIPSAYERLLWLDLRIDTVITFLRITSCMSIRLRGVLHWEYDSKDSVLRRGVSPPMAVLTDIASKDYSSSEDLGAFLASNLPGIIDQAGSEIVTWYTRSFNEVLHQIMNSH